MTDQEFLAALEDCTLPKAAFNHSGHIRAGYLYLTRHPFGIALDKIKTAIQRYAASLGVSDLYHETITVAYMALINQHLAEWQGAESWDAFAAGNPGLFDKGLLARYYRDETLKSPRAKRMFVLDGHAPARVTI
jgi:hypothetical protein